MNCKICSGNQKYIFSLLTLKKYEVKYYLCEECEFLATEAPFWLDEAYSEVITSLDIGLISRNLQFSQIVCDFIEFNKFKSLDNYLDFGGGYGIFVRMMRDRGFNFYREDRFCDNLFAKNFDLNDLNSPKGFQLLTAFEVFEHIENPIQQIKEMFELSDSIFFSTEIHPEFNDDLKNWWYLIPSTGQHISLFSIKSFYKISEILNVNYYTNGKNLHLLTKRKFAIHPFGFLEKSIVQKIFRKINSIFEPKKRGSLLESDFDSLNSKL